MINQKRFTTLTKKTNKIKTLMLRSDLGNFSDEYIVVKGNIIVNKKTFAANDFDAPNNSS